MMPLVPLYQLVNVVSRKAWLMLRMEHLQLCVVSSVILIRLE